MNAAAEKITASINEGRMLSHLKNFFSKTSTVLSECMQNARRAGATQVEFAHTGTTLSITDNGCGVTNFKDLITLAGSGWSEEMMASEQPFGVGFFSVCFVAEKICVESKGKQISFSAEDVIEKHPINIVPSSFIGGTRITLTGFKMDSKEIEEALQKYATGFAIPVVWQGTVLPRPHAREFLDGEETEIGFFHVPGVHDGKALQPHPWGCSYRQLYYQGLPINPSSRYAEEGPTIVHLESNKFQPRMPDRDCLVDSESAIDIIHAEEARIWRTHLEAEKTVMSAVDFVERHWGSAEKWRCLDVMLDVPAIPKSVCWMYGQMPYITDCGYYYQQRVDKTITRSEVELGEVTLVQAPEDAYGFAKAAWVYMQGCIIVDDLPEGHWAQQHVRNTDSAGVRISGKVIAVDHFSGNYVDGKVKIVKDLAVSMYGIKHFLHSNGVAVGKEMGYGGEPTFLIPADRKCACGDVVAQASTYMMENETYDENSYAEDVEAFNNLVSIMSGEDAVVTLRKCLHEAGASRKKNLSGRSFYVQFDAEGKMTITAE